MPKVRSFLTNCLLYVVVGRGKKRQELDRFLKCKVYFPLDAHNAIA